ncbi:hypothetical protein B7P33_06920 [Sediminicola luteus]|uniref:DUF2752 domain-containing protein n=1 Tax=Sediminicola luteus TaxID=319238 RepID=A0A2A4G7E1_9FLAO|nr:hypothetical protein B7P33_06920 [Sediminicola luteus]
MTNKKLISYLIGVLLIIVVPLYFYADPADFDGWFPKCPVYQATGIYCAGCGSQRAIHDLLHFRIVDSISHNVLIIPAFLIILYHYYQKFQEKRNGSPKPNFLYHPKAPMIIFVIIMVFMILRNIPTAPFTYLNPV